MIELVLALGLLQTHTCDVTPVERTTRRGTFTTQICWTNKDVDGNPATATKLEALVDGVVKASVTNPLPVGAASPVSGKFLYEVPGVLIEGRGTRRITHRFTTVDGAATSDGINHIITNGPPAQPTGDRVKE